MNHNAGRHDIDHVLFLASAAILVAVGIVMVHSASVTSRPSTISEAQLSRHLVFVGLGVIGAITASMISPRRWFQLGPWLFVGTLALLMVIWMPGVGAKVNGAQRWIRVAGWQLQPSEIAKLTLPIVLCSLIRGNPGRLNHWWWGTIGIIWPAAVVVPLILIQPDLGTSVFLIGGMLVALFLGGWPLRNFLLAGLMVVPMGATLFLLKPYQQKRLQGFVEAWMDWNEAPYQIKQSLISLGAGGITGSGLGKGWQKLSFLPEANTDFIFSVVGEELGLIGTGGLMLAWSLLYITGLRALSQRDPASKEFLLGATLLTQIVGQALINIAVVTAMVPPKGIPHPLISVGGSQLMVSLTILGLVSRLAQPDRDDVKRNI